MFPASREGQGRAAATGGGGGTDAVAETTAAPQAEIFFFFFLPYLVPTVQSRWSRAEMLSLPSR